MQELEGERDSLEEALRNERDKGAQQCIALRREITAVQMNSDDEKERKCASCSLQ